MLYEEAKALLIKYKEGNCTDAENALVERWLFQYKNENDDLSDERIQEISQEIWSNLSPQPIRAIKRLQWMRLAAAASILLFLLAGLYFITGGRKQPAVKYTVDITPGGNKAILTLSNGKKIILNNTGAGNIAKEGDASINKTAGGEVVYHDDKTAAANTPAVYNTMSTPNGAQYHLVLADGTNVWLNAASSIKYPTVFSGNERRVIITGEVYFEVAHNAAKPFRVTSQGQTVEVLGTHFNIDAYADEPVIKTTLLEGSVKITDDTKMATLTPGQQAQVKPGTAAEIKVLDHVDTDGATAWKNGLFQFNKASIESIMQQAARWYDVKISYDKNKIPSKTFTGNISMNSNASQFLEILSYTGLHFEIAGKRIIVKSE